MMSSSRKKAVAAGSILVNAAQTRVAACSAATAAVNSNADAKDAMQRDQAAGRSNVILANHTTTADADRHTLGDRFRDGAPT
jgi:hypothetical protein